MNQWHLFLAFFRVGMLGYGGGPSSIPLVRAEVVTKYRWMTDEEFAEILAIANALPGPIATKMAGYIGYEQAGILGAAVAVFASVAPSLILLMALLQLLYKWKDAPQVKRLTAYIRPAIAVMLGIMAIDFFRESRRSRARPNGVSRCRQRLVDVRQMAPPSGVRHRLGARVRGGVSLAMNGLYG